MSAKMSNGTRAVSRSRPTMSVWNLKRVSDPAIRVFRTWPVHRLSRAGIRRRRERRRRVSRRTSSKLVGRQCDRKGRRLHRPSECFAPQIAVPEHLYHYPDVHHRPRREWRFRSRCQRHGSFELTEYTVGKGAGYKARTDYWGIGPLYLETFEYRRPRRQPGRGDCCHGIEARSTACRKPTPCRSTR